MAKAQGVAPNTAMQRTMNKATATARVLDAVLAVLFAYFAYRAGSGGWMWFWAASSVFCVYTAVTAPVRKLPNVVNGILSVSRKN